MLAATVSRLIKKILSWQGTGKLTQSLIDLQVRKYLLKAEGNINHTITGILCSELVSIILKVEYNYRWK